MDGPEATAACEDNRNKKKLFNEVFENEVNDQTMIAEILTQKALEIL